MPIEEVEWVDPKEDYYQNVNDREPKRTLRHLINKVRILNVTPRSIFQVHELLPITLPSHFKAKCK